MVLVCLFAVDAGKLLIFIRYQTCHVMDFKRKGADVHLSLSSAVRSDEHRPRAHGKANALDGGNDVVEGEKCTKPWRCNKTETPTMKRCKNCWHIMNGEENERERKEQLHPSFTRLKTMTSQILKKAKEICLTWCTDHRSDGSKKADDMKEKKEAHVRPVCSVPFNFSFITC